MKLVLLVPFTYFARELLLDYIYALGTSKLLLGNKFWHADQHQHLKNTSTVVRIDQNIAQKNNNTHINNNDK